MLISFDLRSRVCFAGENRRYAGDQASTEFVSGIDCRSKSTRRSSTKSGPITGSTRFAIRPGSIEAIVTERCPGPSIHSGENVKCERKRTVHVIPNTNRV